MLNRSVDVHARLRKVTFRRVVNEILDGLSANCTSLHFAGIWKISRGKWSRVPKESLPDYLRRLYRRDRSFDSIRSARENSLLIVTASLRRLLNFSPLFAAHARARAVLLTNRN